MLKKDVPDCMLKYLERFTKEFNTMIKREGDNFAQTQLEQRFNIIEGVSWIIYGTAFLLGFIPTKSDIHSYNWNFHLGMGIFMFIAAVILVINISNNEYKKKVKNKLFPKLLKVFSKDINYGRNGVISANTFDKSNLFKKNVCFVSVDDTRDAFGGVYNEVYFRACEAEITWDNGKQGKQREETILFKGLALSFVLNKKLDSNIHIYTKSIFNRPPKGYEKVELEYEKFNRKYDVYVRKNDNDTGQIEARYLLNVSFMERLVGLQTAFRVRKMKCSVLNNDMIILLYTTKDLFEINHLFKDVKDLKQYKHLFNEFASVLSFIDVLKLSSNTKL